MDLLDRMLELSREGYFCTQILLILALEADGKDNPDLVRAMGGLNGGMGNTGGICGCLTGGCCFLSYYAGKGENDELPHPDCNAMIDELAQWFRDYTAEFGGCSCRQILEHDDRNKLQRCPALIGATLERCMELLEEHGVL